MIATLMLLSTWRHQERHIKLCPVSLVNQEITLSNKKQIAIMGRVFPYPWLLDCAYRSSVVPSIHGQLFNPLRVVSLGVKWPTLTCDFMYAHYINPAMTWELSLWVLHIYFQWLV